MFSISPQDALVARRNLALTTTLTFLILFFAILDVAKIDNSKKSTENTNGNHGTMQQPRKIDAVRIGRSPKQNRKNYLKRPFKKKKD